MTGKLTNKLIEVPNIEATPWYDRYPMVGFAFWQLVGAYFYMDADAAVASVFRLSVMNMLTSVSTVAVLGQGPDLAAGTGSHIVCATNLDNYNRAAGASAELFNAISLPDIWFPGNYQLQLWATGGSPALTGIVLFVRGYPGRA